MQSLFGETITDVPAKRRDDRAHAAPVGTGPARKTCRDCRHRATLRFTKSYQKCRLMRASWTSGPATDIRCRDAACRYFEPTEG